MNSTSKFMLTLFAWFLFAWGGFTFLKNEEIQNELASNTIEVQHVSSANYEGSLDLNRVKGEQLIGIVPNALAGHFRLRIDGIGIDQYTDIRLIDLSGVVGLTYTISVVRNNGVIEEIYAMQE